MEGLLPLGPAGAEVLHGESMGTYAMPASIQRNAIKSVGKVRALTPECEARPVPALKST
jgi:hypothetical protein